MNGLSSPNTKAGRLQRACLELLREHERNGDIPTNGRFLFYELEQRGVIPKKYDGVNPRPARTTPHSAAGCQRRDDAPARARPDPVALDRGRNPHA